MNNNQISCNFCKKVFLKASYYGYFKMSLSIFDMKLKTLAQLNIKIPLIVTPLFR